MQLRRPTTADLPVIVGGVVGLVFGVVQFVVLRSAAENAGHWLWDNALGWGLGLPAMYAAGIVGSENPSTAAALGLAAATAIFTGLVAFVVTWVVLHRLPRARE